MDCNKRRGPCFECALNTNLVVGATAKKGASTMSAAVRGARAPRVVRRPRLLSGKDTQLAAFITTAAAAAVYGARYSPSPMNPDIERWYASQDKARLNPPPPVFGPVWTILYALIATAGWRV